LQGVSYPWAFIRYTHDPNDFAMLSSPDKPEPAAAPMVAPPVKSNFVAPLPPLDQLEEEVIDKRVKTLNSRSDRQKRDSVSNHGDVGDQQLSTLKDILNELQKCTALIPSSNKRDVSQARMTLFAQVSCSIISHVTLNIPVNEWNECVNSTGHDWALGTAGIMATSKAMGTRGQVAQNQWSLAHQYLFPSCG
jgi:hypothetical protein